VKKIKSNKLVKILFISVFSFQLHAEEFYIPDPTTDLFRKEALEAFFDGSIIDFFEKEEKKDARLKVLSHTSPEDKNVCHTYSSIKILNDDLIRDIRDNVLSCGQKMQVIISQHFVEVNEPEDGDLVAYYNHEKIPQDPLTHTGIYRGNGLVESKWGSIKAIFLHPKFYSLWVWGNEIRYYRQKKLI